LVLTRGGGACLCGAVRIEIGAAPMAARMCWCRVCQALGGGSATVNVCFPADKVAIEGEVRWHESVADSGTPMRRGFCPSCGTPLFSVAETRIDRARSCDLDERGAGLGALRSRRAAISGAAPAGRLKALPLAAAAARR
jgi:hypothetical protein